NISDDIGSIKNFSSFSITKSSEQNLKSTLISPDISICQKCLSELFDPENRRYQYPFINCTNCGPRYTIIDNIPYDRPNTSMKHFKMCDKCRIEYDEPTDRRFHAQPNACDKCGPAVILYDIDRNVVPADDYIKETARLLREGNIIAIKGLGGFHLAVDGENKEAVLRLRKRKNREEKPFALMSYDIKTINKYAHTDKKEEELLESSQKPIVLLKKKQNKFIVKEVAPENKYIGVMLPYTPLHYILLQYGFTGLVMTSGNLSEEPIAIDNEEAFERLSNIADYFLMHNRGIYLRSDDSVARITAGTTRIIRRSRGYVPVPVFLERKVPQILACGGELKNTVCLTKDNNAFLSQHIGDMENVAAYDFFRMTIEHMKQILHIEPEIIAHDLHPDYMSTRYAIEQHNKKIIPVQHHHAHIASCMAENNFAGNAIGLSFDGTGYGTDGNIWGGEVLITAYDNFKRAAHLEYLPMPGSTSAIKEPWRMALSYLYDTFKEDIWNLDLPVIRKVGKENARIILEMISKNINSPLTSSLGRLFDGVAAILGIRMNVNFEGQAAMALEMLADDKAVLKSKTKIYDFSWTEDEVRRISVRPIIKGVVSDMGKGADATYISTKFHLTLIRLFSEICKTIRAENELNNVVLSGGVFQNSILLKGIIGELEKNNFKIFTHKNVPANDGGLSLGQAVVAAAIAER
ncbi:MAG: carbamoyltransferase HypF, partial [Desulfobacterales bacterium]|nr:carbamoyltransferase HypF [Desulfobacterales bacterium]